MADDQVKYSDLFSNDVITGIENLNRALNEIKEAMAEVKNEAASLGTSMRGMSTATREQQQQVSAGTTAADQLRAKLEQLRDAQNKNLAGWTLLTRSIDGTNMSYDQMKATIAALEKVLHTLKSEEEKSSMGAQSAKEAISRLKAAMKSFGTTTEEVVRVNRAYKKLTDEEIASVEALKAALAGTKMQQMDAVKAIDIQSKSYNELYQTYNAIKDVLNGMTVAERENSEAGKLMVDRAKEIRDTLNNLQQATGNYTLNVGNYMSALNGLQFQTQQVLREIPSAQNLSQFFLAISNNIPMFADALARYNKGLPEIKAKLAAVTAEIARQNAAMAAMNTQSAEYAAAQARLNELQRQQQQLQGASVSGWRAILKSVGSWQTLLIAGLLLLRKLPDLVKKLSERWGSARKELHRYTNEMSAAAASAQVMAAVTKKVNDEATELNLIVDGLGNIKQGTKEWEDAISAVNKITGQNLNATTATVDSVREVTRAYMEQAEQLATNSILTDKIAKSNANKQLRSQALSASNLTDLRMLLGIEEDSKEYKELEKTFSSVQRVRKEAEKTIRKNMPYWGEAAVQSAVVDAIKTSSDYGVEVFRKIIYKNFEILSDDAESQLRNSYRVTAPLQNGGKGGNGKKEKEPTEQNVNLRLWDAVKARIRVEKEGYDEERALAKANYEQSLEELRNWALREQAALKENRDNGFITEEEYQQKLKNLNSNYFDLRKGLRDDYDKAIDASIQKEIDDEEKAAKEAERLAKDNAKKLLDAEVQNWEKRRTEMVEQGKTRKEMLEAEFAAEIARLNVMKDLNRDVNGEKMSDEQRQKVEEWIKLLKQLQAAGNFRGIKLGSIFGKGASGLGGEKNKSGNYSNIMDVLFPDMTKDQQSALNSVFDQAKAALNSWMDARKAAADQAKELADDEVSAAENALNREIELRNQGYANNVALRERELADAKERQKKALEMQQKAKEEELAINTAMEASSMAVAIANLFKQFPLYVAIPLSATLLGAAAYAKYQAFSQIRSTKYREGGVMLLEGGSHESGHDVNLGIGPDGSNLRAEGGEYFAVINKRNSRKYGSEIPGIVNALNSGMFEDRYIKTSDAVGLLPRIIRADDGSTVDLSAVESGVGQLVKQGESRWTVEGEYRVERYKNRVRRVKIG